MLELLLAIHRTRKAFKGANKLKKVFNFIQADEIARNAAAYGWEIGIGKDADYQIDVSPGNPFMGVSNA